MLLDRSSAGESAEAREIFASCGGGAAALIEVGTAGAFRRPGLSGKGGEAEPGRPTARRLERRGFLRVSVGRAGIVGMRMSEFGRQNIEMKSKIARPRQIVQLLQHLVGVAISWEIVIIRRMMTGVRPPLAAARIINLPPFRHAWKDFSHLLREADLLNFGPTAPRRPYGSCWVAKGQREPKLLSMGLGI